jgi:hypothetical protein
MTRQIHQFMSGRVKLLNENNEVINKEEMTSPLLVTNTTIHGQRPERLIFDVANEGLKDYGRYDYRCH